MFTIMDKGPKLNLILHTRDRFDFYRSNLLNYISRGIDPNASAPAQCSVSSPARKSKFSHSPSRATSSPPPPPPPPSRQPSPLLQISIQNTPSYLHLPLNPKTLIPLNPTLNHHPKSSPNPDTVRRHHWTGPARNRFNPVCHSTSVSVTQRAVRRCGRLGFASLSTRLLGLESWIGCGLEFVRLWLTQKWGLLKMRKLWRRRGGL